jgi:glycosyltransferase involved in cell wall biosynthesis
VSAALPQPGAPAGIVSPPARVRLAIVTNIPAPYRVPVFNCVAEHPGIELQVLYAARKEPDRQWDLPAIAHPHQFLRESVFRRRNGRFWHNNPDVLRALRDFDPQVVLTTGFNPTHIYAFAYAQLYRRRHIAMTDGTVQSEADLSWMHRALRRFVASRSSAFVAASHAGRSLLMGYGAPASKVYLSPLCANSTVSWRGIAGCVPDLDFLFSGRLVGVKNPLFALEVAAGVAKRLGRRTSFAILGSGPLEAALRARTAAIADQVTVHLTGNIQQADVPRWFASARVFLFPSSWDPWGVVANEACLLGVPVLVTPQAGVAGELIQDGRNGFVRPLDLPQWIDAASALLQDPALHARFSQEALRLVEPYNIKNAAHGIVEAVTASTHPR